MPGTPKPIIRPGFSPHWTTVIQGLEFGAMAQNMSNAGRNQGNVLDRYGNTTGLNGTDLNQTVTIGAGWLTSPLGPYPDGPLAGVTVGTGLTGSGFAVQQNLATGLITTTAGSTSGSITTVHSGTFAANQMIGAADIADPTLGTPVPAIAPGTYISSITGSGPYSVTLSQKAVESGTQLFCAAAVFSQLT